jgi:TPR repeat protein
MSKKKPGDAASLNINKLLKAAPSKNVAEQLVEWADATRQKIARGDMMMGILTAQEVAKIPLAYRTAAQHGDANAWIKLAWWCAFPQYGEPDVESAEDALQQAIEVKAAGAELELVKIRWFFKRQTATAAERQQAFQLASSIAASNPGDAEALYFLALLTTHGFGVEPSPENGFELQNRAADLGNADAKFELYVHYIQGLGVPKDEGGALNACRRAAEAGHSRAMYNLGAYNASGSGMPKNIPEAIKWYESAANAGNPSAMVGLAAIYGAGDGVEANREYAKQLLDQAEYCGLDVSGVRKTLGL